MWKQLTIISFVIFGAAQCASLATAADKDSECSTADAFKVLTCFFRFQDFMSKIGHLDKDDKESIKEFKKTCDSLTSCFGSIKCGQKEEEHDKMLSHISTLCSSVVFTYDDFGECMTKLETRNSTCFQNWTPLKKLDDKSKLADEEKFEALKKEMCTNIFGKEKCMKQEIIDDCGKEKWEGAKKHFTALVKTSVECDTSDL